LAFQKEAFLFFFPLKPSFEHTRKLSKLTFPLAPKLLHSGATIGVSQDFHHKKLYSRDPRPIKDFSISSVPLTSLAVGFANIVECKQSTTLTCPTTFGKVEGPQRLTSGSVLSSKLILDMSSSHLSKMLLAAHIQSFTNSNSLRHRSADSAIFLASHRSFRTVIGYQVYEVRSRYNLSSCQASNTNISDTLSISLPQQRHHYHD